MCLFLAVGTLLSLNSQQGPYPKMVKNHDFEILSGVKPESQRAVYGWY